MFAFELASVDKSTIDANKWGFFSDFDRDADCVRNNGNPADRDCCWNGMSPFILYNTNTKQCCPDGKPVGFGKSCGDKDDDNNDKDDKNDKTTTKKNNKPTDMPSMYRK